MKLPVVPSQRSTFPRADEFVDERTVWPSKRSTLSLNAPATYRRPSGARMMSIGPSNDAWEAKTPMNEPVPSNRRTLSVRKLPTSMSGRPLDAAPPTGRDVKSATSAVTAHLSICCTSPGIEAAGVAEVVSVPIRGRLKYPP